MTLLLIFLTSRYDIPIPRVRINTLKYVTMSTTSTEIATGEQTGCQQDHSDYRSGFVDRNRRICHLDRGRSYRW
jgi:hypothetical protein